MTASLLPLGVVRKLGAGSTRRRLFRGRIPFPEEDKPRALLEGGPHHPALDGLRRAPVPHQRHRGLVLCAGEQAAQLGHLQGEADC